ncbi:hypothetical protein J1614_001507 [Plenodomus biglobosus]|nr:hypothetical protein J1614_001507 [Plenodomus biglobosus]
MTLQYLLVRLSHCGLDTLPQSITIDKGQLAWIILAVAVIIGLKVFLWPQFKIFCAERTTNIVFWQSFGGQCFALVVFLVLLVAIVGYAAMSGWVKKMKMEMVITSPEPLSDLSYPPIPTAPPIHCPDGQSLNCHAPYFSSDVEISLVDFIMQCTLQRHQIRRGDMPGN